MADVFYTIAPIHHDEDKRKVDMQLINYQQASVLVQSTEEGNYQIMQLCSTNPKDYLNPQLQPGTVIKTGVVG